MKALKFEGVVELGDSYRVPLDDELNGSVKNITVWVSEGPINLLEEN